MLNKFIYSFNEIDKTMLSAVGGKGANLGELSKIPGLRVPDGFCVTTVGFRQTVKNLDEFDSYMNQLKNVKPNEMGKISAISRQIRLLIENAPMDKELKNAITVQISLSGEDSAYAVRSSATSEDLPEASFAGQQDTFLNLHGKDSILTHIKKCWASLFTDRAVTYRIKNGFDHESVLLSVVVQKMVLPDCSGIMFTADPITSNRKVLSIDAGYGLGEALVSGLTSADNYRVREGKILEKNVRNQKLAIVADSNGGTVQRKIEIDKQGTQWLTDAQILELELIGRTIEKYFGCPQDIEWAVADGEFYILQSRPITTLYPVPKAKDGCLRIYSSYGHQNMMTDAFKPLGISFNDMFMSFAIAGKTSHAGGRIYFDFSSDMKSPIMRKLMIDSYESQDHLMCMALRKVSSDKEFVKHLPKGKSAMSFMANPQIISIAVRSQKEAKKGATNIAAHVKEQRIVIEKQTEEIRSALREKIDGEVFAYIDEYAKNFGKRFFNKDNQMLYGLMMIQLQYYNWVKKHMKKWLQEENAIDELTKSVLGNVTTEMGFALMDLADTARKHPDLCAYLENAKIESLWDDINGLDGGGDFARELHDFLYKFGMRCQGEIDITRPRWNEDPTAVFPMILVNVRNFQEGAGAALFEKGRLESEQKAKEYLERIEKLPGGRRKAKTAKHKIEVLRSIIGYREYPKYTFMSFFLPFKESLMREAERLAQSGAVDAPGDVFYLYFNEFWEVAKTGKVDKDLIESRKREFKLYEKLTPPRVITSEGEIITGEYTVENIPEGALPGTPVSVGVIEGRARVILDPSKADLMEGDILVTVFTDPSWTPLFVSAKGLVTEIGGVGTHGAVIAREYGIPGIVGVENATTLIKDGQRIRINASAGYVELL